MNDCAAGEPLNESLDYRIGNGLRTVIFKLEATEDESQIEYEPIR